VLSSVADRHHIVEDPDPAFHYDADADPDPDPTFQFNAYPYLNPTTHFFADFGPLMLKNDPLRLPHFHFDADPDPAFHFYANPDQVSQNDADPCGSGTLPLRPLFHYRQ
jgi:hypothetical protein